MATKIFKVNALAVFLLIVISGYGQDRMYVYAKSGLVVRERPTIKSKKIDHLPNNTMVLITRKTGIRTTVMDNGNQIDGVWIEILSGDGHGYVLDAYLSTEIPDIWYVQRDAYYKMYSPYSLQDGTFVSQSLPHEYLKRQLPEIEPNNQILDAGNYPYYLNPDNEEIVLFANHDLNNLEPVGVLKAFTQVYVDSTIHKFKYKDFTNCVWNRIIINERAYYTDFDIHDFEIRKELKELDQNLIIVGQYGGYDGAYHLGYPEQFFLIFTNHKKEVIYRTKILDFDSGDEFGMEEDLLRIAWNDKLRRYEIILLGNDDKINIHWDGNTPEIFKD